jgi:hypothetical protein
MKKDSKVKQIAVRFDSGSYGKISEYAELEHRGLGEFVRHATLYYIENFGATEKILNQKGGRQP